MSVQFSITKLADGQFHIVVQTEKVVVRSYSSPENRIIADVQSELKMLRPARSQ